MVLNIRFETERKKCKPEEFALEQRLREHWLSQELDLERGQNELYAFRRGTDFGIGRQNEDELLKGG